MSEAYAVAVFKVFSIRICISDYRCVVEWSIVAPPGGNALLLLVSNWGKKLNASTLFQVPDLIVTDSD